MLRWILLSLVILEVIAVPASAQNAPETAPTTQPAGTTAITEEPQKSTGMFGDTPLGKFFYGEKQLTPEEALRWGFWLDLLKGMIRVTVAFIPRLFVAILCFVIFWLIYRAVRGLVLGSLNKARIDPSIRDMLGNLIKWTIMGFGLVIACNQIGIEIAALLTGVSIIGLAVGFAAQETLANFIAGVVIFMDKPFKVGDWLLVEDELAQVARVTFRSTRLNNLDNDVVVIPNTVMLSQKFINKSTNPVTRASVSIGIAYKESIEKARQVLLSTVVGDERVLTRPEPIVEVRECAASSVDLKLHFWIRDEKYEDAMSWEYLEKAKVALDAAGIEIPFPHVQLLVEETPAMKALAKAG
jgi:small conductance mechanosensitive channel